MNKYAPPMIPNLPRLYEGKTRETYELPDGKLLIVATDRLSTHNVVHESAIPFKGQVLTALTIFWLTRLAEIGIATHLVDYGSRIFWHLPPGHGLYPADLRFRAIVVKRLEIIPVEFIYRSYLTGSLYRDFYAKGRQDPYGLNLPKGLVKMSRFPEPVFTPTEKSETDDPLDAVGVLRTYPDASDLARRGFIATSEMLAASGVTQIDGKFEVGIDEQGHLHLADEAATPDSSRFARTADIREGEDPPWLDKQVARDEAERIWAGGSKVPLAFPPFTVSRLTDAYRDSFKLITGLGLYAFQEDHL